MNSFMKRIALAAAAVIGLVASAVAGPYYDLQSSTNTGTSTLVLPGVFAVAKSSVANITSSATIRMDGASGSINASSATLKYGVSAATGAFSGNVAAGSLTGPTIDAIALATTTVAASTTTLQLEMYAAGYSTMAIAAATTTLANYVNSQFYSIGTSTTGIAASTTTIYAAINSTGAALTTESARAIARENMIGNSTGTIYVALNSTGAALTIETARANAAESVLTSAVNSTGSALSILATATQASTATLSISTASIYVALNSTASALSILTTATQASTATLSISTASIYVALNSTASALSILTTATQTSTATLSLSTASIYVALNSTATALTNEITATQASTATIALSTQTLAGLLPGNGNGLFISTNAVFNSSVTFLGSAFSVGGGSFTVSGGSATVGYSLTAGDFISNCFTPGCRLGPVYFDGTTPSVTVTSSVTVTGAGGLGVTYGITVGTISVGGSMAAITSADQMLINSNTAGAGLGIRFGANNNSVGGRISYDANDGATYYDNLYDNAGGSIFFRTRVLGTPIRALSILGGGNVGIGTSSPGSTLDVNGAATIRAQETVTSTLTVQGSAFSVGGSSFTMTGGTGTIAYALTVGALYSTGSITASSGTFTQIGTGNYALALSTSITFAQSAGNGLGIRWGDGSVSTTAASGSSGSSAVNIFIATAPQSGIGAWQAPQESTFTFDSTFVNVIDTPTIKGSFITFKNMGGITSAPTRTIYTAGSGTYTPPNGVSMLRVRECGGGGGGGGVGGSQTTSPNNGGYSSFNSIISTGGVAGTDNIGTTSTVGTAGGTGGTGGTSPTTFRTQGLAGGMGTSLNSGQGGGSAFFGGGAASLSLVTGTGNAGTANTGGGASGGCWATSRCGSGGSGAECVETIITSPTSYSYTVGAGGAGSVCSIANGGAGGSGVIIIDEYYGTQGFAAPVSTQVYPNGTISAGQTTFTNCVANSTATWTATANRAQMCFSGSISAGAHTQLSLELDGAYLPGYTSTLGITGDTNGAGNNSFCVITPALAAGVHNVCLTAESNGGTITIPGSSTLNGVAVLSVYELKNTAGTGDVSSNGTNNLTGATTIASGGAFTIAAGATMTTSGLTFTASSSMTLTDGNLYISSAGATTPEVSISSTGGGSITVSSWTYSGISSATVMYANQNSGGCGVGTAPGGFMRANNSLTGMRFDSGNSGDLLLCNGGTNVAEADGTSGFTMGGLTAGHTYFRAAAGTVTSPAMTNKTGGTTGISIVLDTVTVISQGYTLVEISSASGASGGHMDLMGSSLTIRGTGSQPGMGVYTSTNTVLIAPSGYMGFTGPAPTYSGCGTVTDTAGLGSTSQSGSISMGGSPGNTCTVTFAAAFTNTPSCVVTLGGSIGTGVFGTQGATSTAHVIGICDNATGLASCGAGTTLAWHCDGN